MFLGFFLGKSLDGIEIIRTFASAFAQKFGERQEERVLWKIYIDRSSTRSEYFSKYLGRKETNRLILEILDSRSETDNIP